MKKRGQIAQEALISFVTYTLFIMILLSATIQLTSKIQQQQEQKTQQQINNYRCNVIDNLATLQTENIIYDLENVSDLNCITKVEKIGGQSLTWNQIEKRQLD